MSKMLRLKESESEAIRKKAVDVNKKLVNLGKEPIKDSELIHKLLDLAIKNVIVNKYGELEI